MVRVHYLHPEVLSMRGSFIAKQIDEDNRRYAYEKARALRLKKLKEIYERRKKGESNGEQRETENIQKRE